MNLMQLAEVESYLHTHTSIYRVRRLLLPYRYRLCAPLVLRLINVLGIPVSVGEPPASVTLFINHKKKSAPWQVPRTQYDAIAKNAFLVPWSRFRWGPPNKITLRRYNSIKIGTIVLHFWRLVFKCASNMLMTMHARWWENSNASRRSRFSRGTCESCQKRWSGWC